jgi:periplasmic protein CpxP/Spy
MKTWIKRTLIGLASISLLFGGMAAWAHRQAGHHMGWRSVSEADAAQMKAHLVERVGSKLDLNAEQKNRLATLAEQLRQSRNALVAATPDPRSELQSLMAGTSFDRSKAIALVQAQLGAINNQSPALINAMADFYDSLSPGQQAQVREFMAKRGHHPRS